VGFIQYWTISFTTVKANGVDISCFSSSTLKLCRENLRNLLGFLYIIPLCFI